jgi:tetratricopeptide (TPR) repeat protein
MTAARRCSLGIWFALLPLCLALKIGSAFDGQTATDTVSGAASDAAPNSSQSTERIATLIKQLGDSSFLVRQAAQTELSHIGPEAFDLLTAAENNPDIEISSRAKYLVQQIRAAWIHESDSPQVRRILDKYELLDDTGRLQALGQLAFLPHDVGLVPLCRLMRFERSPLVSKYSAMLIIGQPDAVGRSWKTRRSTIETNLAQNTNPGAQWLRAYLHYHDDPQAATPEVDKLVAAELESLVPFTNDAQRQATLALEGRILNVLEENFNRPQRAQDILQKLLPLVATDRESVSGFTDLLVRHEAWDLVDQLAHRADAAFSSDSILLYTWAHALRAQGKDSEADKLSERAFQLIGNSLEEHAAMGQQLARLGIFDGAQREYQYVIDTSPQDTELTIKVQNLLAEILHDQEKDLQAAEVLKKLVDAMEKDQTVSQRAKEFAGVGYPDTIRGNMHQYYAAHYASQHDAQQQQRELEEGAKADPSNADILIGLYTTSANDPARRKEALELIHAADKEFRETIAQQPSSFQPYNQDAWLIGNTEGDFDLAIQYSQTSIELLKNQGDESRIIEPGFLDTLAHCYAGKGDFENAVKYQARATELDPHTLQIRRALDNFKKQLEKTSATKTQTP